MTVPMRIAVKSMAERKRPIMVRTGTAGLGRVKKVALLGGAKSLRYAPWHDLTWELWAHMSCRRECEREPDAYFDLHPPDLWRNPEKKFWDKKYLTWLAANRVPIYMQEQYPEAPASLRYPFETMITEFPRGYMTNTLAYMVALALMQGATHIGVFGCHYDAWSEYGPQRGSAEYWLGVAEGRGVHILIPPTCDLLNRPSLLYGYQSHPNGIRDKSYTFGIGVGPAKDAARTNAQGLIPANDPKDPSLPPLRDIGKPPALERRDTLPSSCFTPVGA